MKLYTMQEVMQLIGVSMRQIHKYLSEGILEGAKYGNSWRFSESQLEEFHERMTRYSMRKRRHDTETPRTFFFSEEREGEKTDDDLTDTSLCDDNLE